MTFLKYLLFFFLLAVVPASCGNDDPIGEEPPIDNPEPDPQPEPTPDPEDEIPASIADSSYYYYNKAFLLKGTGEDSFTYYRENQTSEHWAYYWNQALIILMVEDRYYCRGDESLKPFISDLLHAFLEHEKNPATNDTYDWTWNDYTDDLLWAGLAFIRGYQITGEERFLAQAKWDWEFLYNRAYDTALGGGLWWSVEKSNKSGLSNNPAVSMASYLYEATGDELYREQAIDLYNWIYNTLRQPDGSIDENISKDGTLTRSYNVYNVGAFIEAANALHRITGEEYYLQDAHKSIEYVMRHKVTDQGILSKWHRDGTWQSEFARGMGLFVKDNNLWDYQTTYTNDRKPTSYYEWMKLNAEAAWHTHNADCLTFNEWEKTTPDEPGDGKTWTALEMVSSVVMTQVTPDKHPTPVR